MYTTATALLDALVEHDVEYLFANFGSDHPALIESLAEARITGRKVPRVITCPSEMVALSIAHGYAQITGRAQAVIVHVDCGTLALAGAIHNIAKARVPVLIFAGASPFTLERELPGSRNEFIQWHQDVHDQRGIVRGYMRYDAEIRTGANVKQLVHRALQLAHSDPCGPVYLMAAREVLEQEARPAHIDMQQWRAIEPTALSPKAVEELCVALLRAERPLIVTSYVGRRVRAVTELVRLCRRLGIGVLESVPTYVNFPADDPLYLGNQWNQPHQHPALAAADVVLVIDSDVPWIPAVNRPAAGATIYHIDVDPLKEQMPLWYIGALRRYRADSLTALLQLNASLDDRRIDLPAVQRRAARQAQHHSTRAARLTAAEHSGSAGNAGSSGSDVNGGSGGDAGNGGSGVRLEALLARIRVELGPSAVVVNEGVTNYSLIVDHLALTRPGAMLTAGGGSLGWGGGAAIGVKLARPDAEVIALVGDGSYLFSMPASVHWIARRYQTPFLEVVLNNRGWNAPRASLLGVHPDGHASRSHELDLSFEPSPHYAEIAAAAGAAHGIVIQRAQDIDPKIAEAFRILRTERRSVVVDAQLQQ